MANAKKNDQNDYFLGHSRILPELAEIAIKWPKWPFRFGKTCHSVFRKKYLWHLEDFRRVLEMDFLEFSGHVSETNIHENSRKRILECAHACWNSLSARKFKKVNGQKCELNGHFPFTEWPKE